MTPWTPEALALSERLAHSLGQMPVAVMIHEELRPGVLDERLVQSSRHATNYRMVRTRGGWQHADIGCEGWLFGGNCYHVKELNMETSLVPHTANVLALIDEIEDSEIVAAISSQVTKAWVYEFPMGGQTVRGLSATGVEEAARELGKHGEAIREMDVKVEYEDEHEARFIAQAGRYAISHDGKEVLLDVAIRAKRQLKRIKLRTGGWQEDESWYEKGITKAVRNAKLALLPEMAKTQILAAAITAGRVRQVDGPPPRQQPARAAPKTIDAPLPDATADDATTQWWAGLRAAGYERDAVIHGSQGKYQRDPWDLSDDERTTLGQELLAAKQGALPV